MPTDLAGDILPFPSLESAIETGGHGTSLTIGNTVGSLGDRTREGNIELFRPEANLDRRLEIEYVLRVADPETRTYLESA